MDNLRKEFIKEILETLKIPLGAFNVGTVADEIKHIPDTDLRAFHKALFGTDHSFLNGMDRIIKVAEQFKPVHKDLTEVKAKELILFCETANTQIGEYCIAKGIDFVEHVRNNVRLKLSDEDIAILNQVKSHQDHKQLIIKIRQFPNSLEQLNAFKRAVEYTQTYSGAIKVLGLS